MKGWYALMGAVFIGFLIGCVVGIASIKIHPGY